MSARWQRCPGPSASTFPFRTPEGAVPVNLVASVPFSRCWLSTVSTHYKASPHAAGARPWTGCIRTACAELRRVIQNRCHGRSKRTSASFRHCETLCSVVRLNGSVSVTSRRFGGRYRIRTCDFQILNLVLYPSELTDVDVPWSEPIHGTGRTRLKWRATITVPNPAG